MVHLVDQRLKVWVQGIAKEMDVSLAPPNPQKTGRGVCLYLMEIAQAPPPSTGKLSPLQLALRYLVTAWSDEPEHAHRVLGELMFAAMENPGVFCEWSAIQPPSRYGQLLACPHVLLLCRIPLRKERLRLQRSRSACH